MQLHERSCNEPPKWFFTSYSFSYSHYKWFKLFPWWFVYTFVHFNATRLSSALGQLNSSHVSCSLPWLPDESLNPRIPHDLIHMHQQYLSHKDLNIWAHKRNVHKDSVVLFCPLRLVSKYNLLESFTQNFSQLLLHFIHCLLTKSNSNGTFIVEVVAAWTVKLLFTVYHFKLERFIS